MENFLNKIKKFLPRSRLLVLVAGFIVLSLFFFLLNFDFKKQTKEASEITAIKTTADLKLQNELYRKLIERVGPLQAQEDLYRSGLPFNGQTHLLNHVVGDFLYEKYGSEGLPYCRDYFLSSCYHGFILHAIAEGGMPEVAKSFSECLKFGTTVSTQCAHAIGHGFLAHAGYKNLTKALKTCDRAIETMPKLPAFNCYDGVFMENIWAVHDDGSPSPDRWVKENDHFYPCNDKRIDSKYLLGCWSNQPSLAYQQFKGDSGRVGREVCGKVRESDLQKMCFDGLARQIHPLTKGDVAKVFSLCGAMPEGKWVNYCVAVNAASSYAVGDRNSPFIVCDQADEGSMKEECYQRIFGVIRSYQKPDENLKDLCSKVVEDKWRKKCETP